MRLFTEVMTAPDGIPVPCTRIPDLRVAVDAAVTDELSFVVVIPFIGMVVAVGRVS